MNIILQYFYYNICKELLILIESFFASLGPSKYYQAFRNMGDRKDLLLGYGVSRHCTCDIGFFLLLISNFIHAGFVKVANCSITLLRKNI